MEYKDQAANFDIVARASMAISNEVGDMGVASCSMVVLEEAHMVVRNIDRSKDMDSDTNPTKMPYS